MKSDLDLELENEVLRNTMLCIQERLAFRSAMQEKPHETLGAIQVIVDADNIKSEIEVAQLLGYAVDHSFSSLTISRALVLYENGFSVVLRGGKVCGYRYER